MKKKSDQKNKGVSPLIATVLIIGFTVVLAVLVINWALPFVRNLQETTEESSNIQIACAQDVIFSIRNACKSGTNQVRLTVSNDGSKDIDNFIGRFSRSIDDVEQIKLDFSTDGNGITSFDIESSTASVTSEPIKIVELIPVVTISGKSVTCSTNIRKFGSLDSSGLRNCS